MKSHSSHLNNNSRVSALEHFCNFHVIRFNPVFCSDATYTPDRAIEGYSVAIEAVERSRSWANTDKRRQEVLGAAIDVYAKMVQVRVNTAIRDNSRKSGVRSKKYRLPAIAK